jgi:hypothetical protein
MDLDNSNLKCLSIYQTVWYGLVTISLLTKNYLPETTPALYEVTVS